MLLLKLCRERRHRVAVTCRAGDAPPGIGTGGCEQQPPQREPSPAPAALWQSWAATSLLAQLASPSRAAPPASFGNRSPRADPAGTGGTVGSCGFVHILPGVTSKRVLYIYESNHQTGTNPVLDRYSGLSLCSGVSGQFSQAGISARSRGQLQLDRRVLGKGSTAAGPGAAQEGFLGFTVTKAG